MGELMVRLIASDLDGTLLQNGTKEISKEAVYYIKKLYEYGVVFAAASGRQYPNIRRLFSEVENEIACNVHFKPLPMMTAYKNLGFTIVDYPNAYQRFANEITLPLHTKLTDEEVNYIIKKYTEIVKQYL